MEELDLTSIMNDPSSDEEDDTPDYNAPDEWAPYLEDEQEPPAPTPQSDEKYGQDRRRRILHIQMYLNEFPEKFAAHKKTNLEKLSNEELAKLLEELQYILGAGGMVSATVRAMMMSIQLLETTATTFTPLQISGLSQNINNNQAAIDDMKAIALKHSSLIAVEPEVRLGFTILQTAFTLHTINSMTAARATPAVEEAAPEGQLVDPPDPAKFDSL